MDSDSVSEIEDTKPQRKLAAKEKFTNLIFSPKRVFN